MAITYLVVGFGLAIVCVGLIVAGVKLAGFVKSFYLALSNLSDITTAVEQQTAMTKHQVESINKLTVNLFQLGGKLDKFIESNQMVYNAIFNVRNPGQETTPGTEASSFIAYDESDMAKQELARQLSNAGLKETEVVESVGV